MTDIEKQKLARQFDNAKDKLTEKYYDDCNKLWQIYQIRLKAGKKK